jgi:hypothetical protein
MAVPRFSYAAVPCGKVPSSRPVNTLTGRSSPFWRLIGTAMLFTKSTRSFLLGSAALMIGTPASVAVAQAAGILNSRMLVTPSSMAAWFMLTIFSPRLPYVSTTACFM